MNESIAVKIASNFGFSSVMMAATNVAWKDEENLCLLNAIYKQLDQSQRALVTVSMKTDSSYVVISIDSKFVDCSDEWRKGCQGNFQESYW